MQVRIYRPTKSTMQAGYCKNHQWRVRYQSPQNSRFIEPHMGWTGSKNMLGELDLSFSSLEAAVQFAVDNNYEYTVINQPKKIISVKRYLV